jgi:hypothetical protein
VQRPDPPLRVAANAVDPRTSTRFGDTRTQVTRDLEPRLAHYLHRHPLKVPSLTYDYVSGGHQFDTPHAYVEALKRLEDRFNMGRVFCWFNPAAFSRIHW